MGLLSPPHSRIKVCVYTPPPPPPPPTKNSMYKQARKRGDNI